MSLDGDVSRIAGVPLPAARPLAKLLAGPTREDLSELYRQVRDDEARHTYHRILATTGRWRLIRVTGRHPHWLVCNTITDESRRYDTQREAALAYGAATGRKVV